MKDALSNVGPGGVARQILEDAGCRVTLSEEGETAIRLFRQAKASGRPFDVVIMDLTVPGGMGGQAAAARILTIDPEARIIVSSGYTEADAMASFRAHGFVGRLTKPFEADDLLRTVSEVCTASMGTQENG